MAMPIVASVQNVAVTGLGLVDRTLNIADKSVEMMEDQVLQSYVESKTELFEKGNVVQDNDKLTDAQRKFLQDVLAPKINV